LAASRTRLAHGEYAGWMTRDEWIAAFAREAGVEKPSVAEVRELLELAGTAAHASERTAAPIACWIAGRSQRPLAELRDAAERIAPSGPQPG
jgi:Domain of unknown function (DUF6457)